MRAYKNIRFIDGPDIADIRSQGRKSSVGRNDEKNYTRVPHFKATIRRVLKRRDRASENRFDQIAEQEMS